MASNFLPQKTSPGTAPGQSAFQAQKEQELALHDGLDRLEDFTLMLAFQSYGCQFEILSITPPADTHVMPPVRATTRTDSSVVNLHEIRLKKTA